MWRRPKWRKVQLVGAGKKRRKVSSVDDGDISKATFGKSTPRPSVLGVHSALTLHTDSRERTESPPSRAFLRPRRSFSHPQLALFSPVSCYQPTDQLGPRLNLISTMASPSVHSPSTSTSSSPFSYVAGEEGGATDELLQMSSLISERVIPNVSAVFEFPQHNERIEAWFNHIRTFSEMISNGAGEEDAARAYAAQHQMGSEDMMRVIITTIQLVESHPEESPTSYISEEEYSALGSFISRYHHTYAPPATVAAGVQHSPPLSAGSSQDESSEEDLWATPHLGNSAAWSNGNGSSIDLDSIASEISRASPEMWRSPNMRNLADSWWRQSSMNGAESVISLPALSRSAWQSFAENDNDSDNLAHSHSAIHHSLSSSGDSFGSPGPDDTWSFVSESTENEQGK